ncbi:hypothetical protein DdX_20599 [Ditylenchus destructor]|uniref:Uncharacterized protein n=1 Tax=Ditylenchus destructor TaxID=166010 RepID=A0AAD4MG10_9BILA|nr:hypothetical protein DdX_20599 [Ditylenchus destructor]
MDLVRDCKYCQEEDNKWKTRAELASVSQAIVSRHVSLYLENNKAVIIKGDKGVVTQEEDSELESLLGSTSCSTPSISPGPAQSKQHPLVEVQKIWVPKGIIRNLKSTYCDYCNSTSHHLNDCWVRKGEGNYFGVADYKQAVEIVNLRCCEICNHLYDTRFKVCKASHLLAGEMGCPECRGLPHAGFSLSPVFSCTFCQKEQEILGNRVELKCSINHAVIAQTKETDWVAKAALVREQTETAEVTENSPDDLSPTYDREFWAKQPNEVDEVNVFEMEDQDTVAFVFEEKPYPKVHVTEEMNERSEAPTNDAPLTSLADTTDQEGPKSDTQDGILRVCGNCMYAYESRMRTCKAHHPREFDVGCPRCNATAKVALDRVAACDSCREFVPLNVVNRKGRRKGVVKKSKPRGPKCRINLLEQTTTLLIFCCLFYLSAGEISSGNPMRCQTTVGRQIFAIPPLVRCPNITFGDEPPEDITFNIFRPNTIEYHAEADVCKWVEHPYQYRTRWWGSHELVKSKSKLIEGRLRECKRMIEEGKCHHGPLHRKGNLWKTGNQIEIDWPWPIFSGGNWVTNSTVNCYRYSSVVIAKFGQVGISTTVGTPDECSFKDGICHLKEGPILLWQSDSAQECPFIPMGTVSGVRWGNVWLSDSGELALSFPANNTFTENCGKNLLLSEQGYAIAKLDTHRRKRDMENITGFVTSNQLAAQLTAISLDHRIALKKSFQDSYGRMCHMLENMNQEFQVGFMARPTMAARTLIPQYNIHARVVGGRYLEAWPCEVLEDGSWGFLNITHPFTDNKCYSKPPVWYRTLDKEQAFGFLEPLTNIIWDSSSIRPCSERESLVYIKDRLLAVDQVTGSTTNVQHLVREFRVNNSLEMPNIPRVLFRNMVITNMTEIASSGQLEALMHALKVESQFHNHGLNEHWNEDTQLFHLFRDSWIGKLWGMDGLQLWVYICCMLYSLEWVFCILKTYLYYHCNQLLSWCLGQVRAPFRQNQGPSTMFQEMIVPERSLPQDSPVRRSFRSRLPWPLSASAPESATHEQSELLPTKPSRTFFNLLKPQSPSSENVTTADRERTETVRLQETAL